MTEIKEIAPERFYPELNILRMRLGIQTSEKLPPDFYLGSTWRGIIGWELQKLICPYPGRADCNKCTLNNSCPYFVLFEKKTDLPGMHDAPRGYIFYAPESNNRNFMLEITLMGDCVKYFPAVLQSVLRAQKKGLGRNGIKFHVCSVTESTPGHLVDFDLQKDILSQIHGPFSLKSWLNDIEDNAPVYRMKIKTPLRMRQNGRYISSINLPFMLTALARRLGVISYSLQGLNFFDKEQWLDLKDYFASCKNLPELEGDPAPDKPGIHSRIKWDDYSRFSNRQRKKVPMGGIVGDCSFVVDLPQMKKWLKCAELIHVGKGASMGLGRVEIPQNDS
ncbi:CRISPR system precrRNA processing endoribonuclease RAMP protein Cas6 [Desulfonatronovibrio magnus]|uniref:CRISPR system precrRNA processing endoribonuclease RAMP protein Cas6 n=1 Tax=Desulfonatronovibrio magnus TaxID=698827 RepID=UPI0005EBE0B4|nr:CRISPR system precrRNA processing endoribonuclease RAMP protein Cas6 [Desulfonatronovibrio magnus]